MNLKYYHLFWRFTEVRNVVYCICNSIYWSNFISILKLFSFYRNIKENCDASILNTCESSEQDEPLSTRAVKIWNKARSEHVNLNSKRPWPFFSFQALSIFLKNGKKHRLFNDICREKLEMRYNIKKCKNRILATIDYSLHNHWVIIIKFYNSIKSADI